MIPNQVHPASLTHHADDVLFQMARCLQILRHIHREGGEGIWNEVWHVNIECYRWGGFNYTVRAASMVNFIFQDKTRRTPQSNEYHPNSGNAHSQSSELE